MDLIYEPVDIIIIMCLMETLKRIMLEIKMCYATVTGSPLGYPARQQPFKFHSQSLPL